MSRKRIYLNSLPWTIGLEAVVEVSSSASNNFRSNTKINSQKISTWIEKKGEITSFRYKIKTNLYPLELIFFSNRFKIFLFLLFLHFNIDFKVFPKSSQPYMLWSQGVCKHTFIIRSKVTKSLTIKLLLSILQFISFLQIFRKFFICTRCNISFTYKSISFTNTLKFLILFDAKKLYHSKCPTLVLF